MDNPQSSTQNTEAKQSYQPKEPPRIVHAFYRKRKRKGAFNRSNSDSELTPQYTWNPIEAVGEQKEAVYQDVKSLFRRI